MLWVCGFPNAVETINPKTNNTEIFRKFIVKIYLKKSSVLTTKFMKVRNDKKWQMSAVLGNDNEKNVQ